MALLIGGVIVILLILNGRRHYERQTDREEMQSFVRETIGHLNTREEAEWIVVYDRRTGGYFRGRGRGSRTN